MNIKDWMKLQKNKLVTKEEIANNLFILKLLFYTLK